MRALTGQITPLRPPVEKLLEQLVEADPVLTEFPVEI